MFVLFVYAATNAAATTATRTATAPVVVTEVAESSKLLVVLADEPSPVGGSDGAMDGAQLGCVKFTDFWISNGSYSPTGHGRSLALVSKILLHRLTIASSASHVSHQGYQKQFP